MPRLFSVDSREPKLGIGIVTYNRPACISRAVYAVLKHTKHPFELVVADDGSTEETTEALKPFQGEIVHLKCNNGGVNINKNRLLYYFNVISRCDVTIILEDDAYPYADGWERNWLQGTLKYGHLNNAGEWFAGSRYKGEGTLDDPYFSKDVSAQCVGFSREAISYVGFFDPAFENYGGAHAEHSYRMVRAGYGGIFDGVIDERPAFYLIRGDIAVTYEETGYTAGDEEGLRRYYELRVGPIYRHPWRNNQEQEELWAELCSIVGKSG